MAAISEVPGREREKRNFTYFAPNFALGMHMKQMTLEHSSARLQCLGTRRLLEEMYALRHLMTKPNHKKPNPVEDYVVTQHGSAPLRTFNFELHAVGASIAAYGKHACN